MGNNNRIFYGSQVVQLRPGTTGNPGSTWFQPQGVQSVAMNGTLNTDQAFQLGAIDIYAITENVPEIQVTINKLLDGSCPLYPITMCGKNGLADASVTDFGDTTQLKNKGFAGLSNNTVDFRLGIYSDTKSNVSGTTTDFVLCSGMYLSSLTYTFPVDGNATEEVQLVGNQKLWRKNNPYLGTMTAAAPVGAYAEAKKIARRQFIDIKNSVLPTGSDKTGTWTWMSGGLPTGTDVSLYLQNISISASLGRDQINELGSLAPYARYATFPVEVTSEFEIVGQVGDYVTANDFIFNSGCNVNYSNLSEFPIRIKVCGSGSGSNDMQISLGSGNKLTSVSYAGGDTGGGNVNITYSFRNYNDFYMQINGNYTGCPTV